jgi:hypothetical protein
MGLLPFVLILSLFSGFKGRNWLLVCFISPIILATTFKFSVDVGANHVIVISSIILLNIIIADFLYNIYERKSLILSGLVLYVIIFSFIISSNIFNFKSLDFSVIITLIIVLLSLTILSLVWGRTLSVYNKIKRGVSVATVVILIAFLTITGLVDMRSLYNMDKRPGTIYEMDNKVISWVKNNTAANDIFLICPNYTHPVLMAGRKVFLGGAYFTFTAGYNTDERSEIVKEIYGGTDINEIKRLLKENKIKYIVVDSGNRESQDYKFDETIFSNNFEKVLSGYSDITIYKVTA